MQIFSGSCLVMIVVLSVSAQTLTPAQLEQAKLQLQTDPALSERARRALADDPSLINRIPANRRDELSRMLKSGSSDISDTLDAAFQSTAPESTQIQNSIPVPVQSAGEPGVVSPPPPTAPAAATTSGEEIHGHSLFRASFEPAHYTEVPDEYVIAPGDEILLRFWGRYNQERKYLIGKDGYVFIEPLNRQAYLPGMTYGALKEMVQRVSTSSPGVEGDVRLVRAHPINIHISGHAYKPGTISAPAYYTFWQFLAMSGGPSTTGSVRSIKVVRGGTAVATVDIYDFLKSGRKPAVQLRDNDLIFFGERNSIVRIGTFVRRDGLYEIVEKETLGDLINHAGGLLSNDFSPNIQIERLATLDERRSGGEAWRVIDVDLSKPEARKILLSDGDDIGSKAIAQVHSRFRNDIYITGAGVWVPGRYSMGAGCSSIGDLLNSAGGLRRGARNDAELLRLNPNGLRSSMPLILTDKAILSLPLNPQDSILTFHDSQFVDITYVKTRGFVRDSILVQHADSLTLHGLMQRSGWVHDGALPYVYIKKTDDNGLVYYRRYSIDDTLGAKAVHLDKRDQVIAFDYREFNKILPVTVLAMGKEPLTIEYSDDLTLDVLIHELNGLDPLVDSNHVEICTPELSSDEVFATTSTIALQQSTAQDANLIKPGTIVFFRPSPAKEPMQYVWISGEVLRPGRYPILKRNQVLSSIIDACGGLTETANPHSISIHRANESRPIPVEIKRTSPLKLEHDWILAQNDNIVVVRNDNGVEVQGAVFSPGLVSYRRHYSWKNYVWSGAGGPLDSAAVKNSYVKYPNGRTEKARRGFHRARIVPGCIIVVPYKPPKPPRVPGEGFDYAKMIGATSASVTTLLSLFIIMTQLK